ncbi:hypothetical protein ACP70R_031419 [Stipagrostis hirtigluma subsp. patula]
MEAAVVSSTEGVLRILLGKLGTVLAEKYVLLSGVGQEIQELKDDLESMNACLRDLATGSDYHHSEQTRTWMKQVREVAYDAEDCIDTFWHHNGRPHCDNNLIAGWLRKIIRPLKTLRAMHSLAVEIRDLKARALKVSERRLRYKVEAAAAGSAGDVHATGHSSPDYTDLGRRLPALNIDESRVVGMSEKKDAVIKLLYESNMARLRVVPICWFRWTGQDHSRYDYLQQPNSERDPYSGFCSSVPELQSSHTAGISIEAAYSNTHEGSKQLGGRKR